MTFWVTFLAPTGPESGQVDPLSRQVDYISITFWSIWLSRMVASGIIMSLRHQSVRNEVRWTPLVARDPTTAGAIGSPG